MIEIKSIDGRVLYTSDRSNIREAVEEAISRSADLRSANLRYADLRSADFRSADFSYADFSYADFSSANLSYADFSSANFRSANLSSANFRSANLSSANFRSANLSSANLSYADFSSADFRYANLSSANFRYADFSYANFSSANFRSAEDAELAIARTRILPEGSLIGWKKARDAKIVQLKIPASAKRSHASGRKCRASKAKVLAIFNPDGSEAAEAFSMHDPGFRYEVGATVTPLQPFDEDPWNECAPGIHFYISREEAEAY